MLWKLGVQVGARDRARLRRAADRKSTLSHLTDEQIVAILRSIPGAGDEVEVARFEALLNAAGQIKAKKEKEAVTGEKTEDKPKLTMPVPKPTLTMKRPSADQHTIRLVEK